MSKLSIPKKALAGILPQRALFTANENDLKGKLTVKKIFNRDEPGIDFVVEEGMSADTIGRIAVQLTSPSNRNFTVSLRQFFSMNIVADSMTKAKIKEEIKVGASSAKITPLYASLMDGDDDVAELPQELTIKHVENRLDEAGNTIYPAYAYKEFNDRVAKLTNEFNNDSKNAGKTFDVGVVYNDFAFMRSLPAFTPESSTIEPQKNIYFSKK